MDYHDLLYQSQQTIMLMTGPGGFPFVAGTVGLLLGSFLNVVVLRGHARHDWRERYEHALERGLPLPEDRKPSGIATERSRCPCCGHQIRWHENIPVLSWILLRAKCRGCSASISPMYLLVEALTCVLTVLCAMRFGFGVQGLSAIAATWLLVAVAVLDLRESTVPTWLSGWFAVPIALSLAAIAVSGYGQAQVGALVGAASGIVLNAALIKGKRYRGLPFIIACGGALAGPYVAIGSAVLCGGAYLLGARRSPGAILAGIVWIALITFGS